MTVRNDKVYALLKGRSQYALADAMGVPQSSINVWLNGKRQPRYQTLVRLAECLDVSTDHLAMTLREISNENKQRS
jgi:transcriptional regulator with XRE-family HTH domain